MRAGAGRSKAWRGAALGLWLWQALAAPGMAAAQSADASKSADASQTANATRTGAAPQASAAAEDLRAAVVALQQAAGARNRVHALTETIVAYETGLGALREALRQTAIREQAIALHLDKENARIAALLGVMTSMEEAPGALLLLHPAGPLATARSGMILAEVTPALQAGAERLRADLAESARLRETEEQALAVLTEGAEAVVQARLALSVAISDRTDLPDNPASDPDIQKRLLENVQTLEDFATRLADAPIRPADAVLRFSDQRGQLPLPAFGQVLRGMNEQDAAGIRRPGLVLATRSGALVTAPWAGTLRFAGPLLDYGNVMILEPESGYLIILGGLGQLFRPVGDLVQAGDALGMMGGAAPEADEFVRNAQEGGGTDLTETLYMELRQGKVAVDPSEWFAGTRKQDE